jgi:hippurate hydrolase
MTDLLEGLLGDAAAQLEDAVDLRRRIHEKPELGNELPGTQAMVLEALDGLPLTVTTGTSLSSVVAVLDGDEPGPTVLLRGDMDALPMPEDTDLDFKSTVDGAMHACGHDTHVAMLAGAAKLLCERRGTLRGRVAFMFQPARRGTTAPSTCSTRACSRPRRPAPSPCRSPSPSTSPRPSRAG